VARPNDKWVPETSVPEGEGLIGPTSHNLCVSSFHSTPLPPAGTFPFPDLRHDPTREILQIKPPRATPPHPLTAHGRGRRRVTPRGSRGLHLPSPAPLRLRQRRPQARPLLARAPAAAPRRPSPGGAEQEAARRGRRLRPAPPRRRRARR
jgi:hypothetical protein